ncbi:hypothetical protein MASR2M16_08550 [Thauera terpenica]
MGTRSLVQIPNGDPRLNQGGTIDRIHVLDRVHAFERKDDVTGFSPDDGLPDGCTATDDERLRTNITAGEHFGDLLGGLWLDHRKLAHAPARVTRYRSPVHHQTWSTDYFP